MNLVRASAIRPYRILNFVQYEPEPPVIVDLLVLAHAVDRAELQVTE